MELLEQYFDTAFDAQNGIKNLRELILTLAMQGKLVPQDPDDPPARELLKKIEAETSTLVKQGEIREPKPLSPVTSEEVPYILPKGWKWVRLGNVGSTNIGLTYSPSDVSESGVPVLRSNNVQNGRLDLSDIKRVAVKVKRSVLVREGDLLICARNGSRALVGKTAMIPALPEEMAFGAFMAIFRSQINPYLLRFINSPLFRQMIDEVNTVTINQITQENLRSTAFPLPPLPEQHRIIAKIDELMARCDALEKLRAERNAQRLAVHTAAVHQLLNVADTDGHIQARKFLGQHFGELYTVKENVAELRKAILQLAVKGKLVPQDPKDPPASELLKQIEAEKKRLVKAGKIREPKNFIASNSDMTGATLPHGWTWTHLHHLVAVVTDGDHQPPPKADRGVPFLVIGNLNKMTINFADCRFVSREYYDDLDWTRKPQRRDVLYTVTGSYGIPIVIDRDVEFCVQRHVAIFKSTPSTPVEYLSWILKSESSLSYATTIATGIAQKTVPLTGLRTMPVPLPPLAEQHRIVAKIDQLMSMCDTLEQQIDSVKETQSAMLNAMMAQYGGQRCA